MVAALKPWLLDSGASTHLISEETLQHVQVLSLSEHVGRDCVTATGASIGVQKSAVVRVCFAVERSSPSSLSLKPWLHLCDLIS